MLEAMYEDEQENMAAKIVDYDECAYQGLRGNLLLSRI
jgi:hypothetical protein